MADLSGWQIEATRRDGLMSTTWANNRTQLARRVMEETERSDVVRIEIVRVLANGEDDEVRRG